MIIPMSGVVKCRTIQSGIVMLRPDNNGDIAIARGQVWGESDFMNTPEAMRVERMTNYVAARIDRMVLEMIDSGAFEMPKPDLGSRDHRYVECMNSKAFADLRMSDPYACRDGDERPGRLLDDTMTSVKMVPRGAFVFSGDNVIEIDDQPNSSGVRGAKWKCWLNVVNHKYTGPSNPSNRDLCYDGHWTPLETSGRPLAC